MSSEDFGYLLAIVRFDCGSVFSFQYDHKNVQWIATLTYSDGYEIKGFGQTHSVALRHVIEGTDHRQIKQQKGTT